MAFYNSLSDLLGDVGSIVKGKNPMNNAPPVNIPATGGVGGGALPIAGGPASTGQTMSAQGTDPSTDPYGTAGGDGSGAVGQDAGNAGGSGVDWGSLISAAGSVAGAVASFAKQYGTTALEAWNIYNAAQRQTQADTYAKQALSTEQGAYDAKAPLRTSGIAGMLNPAARAPNLSNLKQLTTAGSGNPFAKALPIAGVGTQSPAGIAATTPAANGLQIPGQTPGLLSGTPAVPGGAQTGSPLPIAGTNPSGRVPGSLLSGAVVKPKALPIATA